jgi:hypothetical protein
MIGWILVVEGPRGSGFQACAGLPVSMCPSCGELKCGESTQQKVGLVSKSFGMT